MTPSKTEPQRVSYVLATGCNDDVYFMNRNFNDAGTSLHQSVNSDGSTTTTIHFTSGDQTINITNSTSTPGTIELHFGDKNFLV